MIRSAESFRVAGEALFGSAWQATMAAALTVAERTVRRWASGEAEIPEGVWDQLGTLCAHKAGELSALSRDIAGKSQLTVRTTFTSHRRHPPGAK